MADPQQPPFRVAEALSKDVGRAYARLDPQDLSRHGISVGDLVEIGGDRRAVARAMPAYRESRGQGLIQIDGITRHNARCALDGRVTLRPASAAPAEVLTLRPLAGGAVGPAGRGDARDTRYVGRLLEGLPLAAGDLVRAALFGSQHQDFEVATVKPAGGFVLVQAQTQIVIEGEPARSASAPSASALAYEDIGGLRKEIRRVREIIELPLRYPQLFERLGIDPPKGVLLHGPPGTGKTLLARVVARETEASFISVSGPEVIHKFYGESEAKLRGIFEQARKSAPCILFLDEIDAIAPKRETVQGEVEKRVVAQLLALMDGLNGRGQVIVIGATNLPNSLDPALRRPGRFDREIEIGIPDALGRREILEIHTRGMPLTEDVDLGRVAAMAHGFVGADLQSLCREAAMTTLREVMPSLDLASGVPFEMLVRLRVRMDHFLSALSEIEPSAVRELVVEVPQVAWEDVGGLSAVKSALREAVEWPLRYPLLLARAGVRAPKGILLHGPPGTGKTLLAKAVAAQGGVNFLSVKGPALLSKYVGESERGVREIFKKARQAAPCVIFFDEIDALGTERQGGDGDGGVARRVISQLLTEIDGVEELKGVVIIAATNRRDLLDQALLRPGRFDLHLAVPPPDLEGRREIFRVHLRDKPVAAGVDLIELAERAAGLSGADIQAVCSRAALSAVRAFVASRGDQAEADAPALVLDRERLLQALGAHRAERDTSLVSAVS